MIILLLLIFIYFSNIFAQDRLDPHPILDSLTVNHSIFSNTPNKFKKGWNWSSQSKKLNTSLGIEYDQVPIFEDRLLKNYNYPESTIFIVPIYKNTYSKTDVSIFNAQAMHYEVTLKSQKTQFPYFNPNDSLNSSFGFDFINDSIYASNQDIEHNLKLTT